MHISSSNWPLTIEKLPRMDVQRILLLQEICPERKTIAQSSKPLGPPDFEVQGDASTLSALDVIL